MAQSNPHDYSTTEIDSDSEFDSPVKKKLVMSSRMEEASSSINSAGLKNGNQLKDKLNCENSKHANSAGELSCNNNTSSDGDDDALLSPYSKTTSITTSNSSGDIVTKIKVSPSASIEIAKVASFPSTSLISLESSRDDLNNEYLEFKVENKLIQNVYRQELKCARLFHPPNNKSKNNKLQDWKDSGLSSCQESSQEFSSSPTEDHGNFLARSSSSSSTRSLESHTDYPISSQASTQIQQDSDDESDSEDILTRVEEFTHERQEKMKEESNTLRPTSSDLTSSSVDDINDSNLGICRFCMVNPKNGVFVHNNCLHLCCCYKCAVKVWKKRKSCPICNCKIKNVTKLFVH
jgi:hypothetical protein